MKRWRKIAFLCTLAVIMLLWTGAIAREAQVITSDCILKGSNNKKQLKYLTDGNYTTHWKSTGGKNGYLEITLPEGETADGIYVQWYDNNPGWQVQLLKEDKWQTIMESRTKYLSDYLALPEGTTHFRIAPATGVKGQMNIAELTVLGAGETPGWVQQWLPQAEKADLLVLVAHPDDEMLFMGGAIPYYGGEMQKTVQVAYLVPTTAHRRLELLDGLWLCGTKHYPDIGKLRDNYATNLKEMYKRWNKYTVFSHVTRLYRKYKPDVVVTHDIYGEYGHGAHRACADAAIQALTIATNEKKYKTSYEEYGLWDVPKLYIHLYPENVVHMDWRKPLDAFDGKTAFDMAELGFKCHISQQITRYVVEDYGPYDNSLFGLYRSLVGPDVHGNDFFEHID